VIKTNDYLKRAQTQALVQNIDASTDNNYTMMFQLVGVPTLNQKAREVLPFYETLTTSGVYLMLTKYNTFYWIGSEFY
jgi:hypothetical protein